MAALIQLNTGMSISEPVLARLDDLVLDHDIPHLWVRKNSLTDRKTQASIRCVPMLGVSLEAAQELHRRAVRQKSDWLPGSPEPICLVDAGFGSANHATPLGWICCGCLEQSSHPSQLPAENPFG
jgi:hypothetical protein